MMSTEGNELQVLENIIDQSFEVLRNEIISTEDYHIFLFLLSLHSGGMLNDLKEVDDDEMSYKLYDNIEGNLLEKFEILEELYDQVYSAILRRISLGGFSKLIHNLFEIDQKLLQNNFKELFEIGLLKFQGIIGRSGGEFYSPIQLNKFALSLINIPDEATVYNPFGGSATYSILLKQGQKYFGQELNLVTFATGVLRIFAHNIWNNVDYRQEDSIRNWNSFFDFSSFNEVPIGSKKQKYDLIISNPPFGLKMQNQTNGKYGSIRNAESFLIEKGIEQLNDGGKLVAIISVGRLYGGGSELELRKALVNDDLLEMVVSFPSGLLINTAISFAIIVINKSKKLKRKVKFVDASKFISSKSTKSFTLENEALLSLINDSQESDSIKIIDSSEIAENDYDLSVNRYFSIKVDGIALNELGDLVQGFRLSDVVKGKFVRIRDLKEDVINFNLDTDKIEVVDLPATIRCIKQSCLLIPARFNKLKPTYFKYKGVPIYISLDVLAFAIDEIKLDMAYLIQALHSDNVKEQYQSFLTGGVAPMLRKKDFLRIRIPLPNLTNQRENLLAQKAQATGAIEAYFKTSKQEIELQMKFQGFLEDATRDYQSIKHTFRQFLSPLKSNVSGTRKFLIKNHLSPISLDMIFSKNLNQTLEEHLKSMEETIDGLSRLLEDNNSTANNSDTLNLLFLIQNAQRQFKNESVFLFEELVFDKASFEDVENNEEIPPLIVMNKDDFNILFFNVITNAVQHGFKVLKKQNRVSISVSYDNGFCQVSISNNGSPIPSGFTFKDLTTRGERSSDSTGTGTGGADIKKIVEKYSGIFELVNSPEEEFPLSYIIKFPLIKDTKNED